MRKHKYILVAVTQPGAKQLDTIKKEDHVRYMSESSACAYNKTLQQEGLMYIPLENTGSDYYEGIEIAGEGYDDFKEEQQIDQMFDNLFMVNEDAELVEETL